MLAATVKKERAALRKLARYLHQLGLIDATVDADGGDPDRQRTSPRRGEGSTARAGGECSRSRVRAWPAAAPARCSRAGRVGIWR